MKQKAISVSNFSLSFNFFFYDYDCHFHSAERIGSVINRAVTAPTRRQIETAEQEGRDGEEGDGSLSPERKCAENGDEGVNPALNPHDLSLLNCHLKILILQQDTI